MRIRIIAAVASLAAVAGIALAGAGTAGAACMGNKIDDLTGKSCEL